MKKVSNGFELLLKETGKVGPAYGQLIQCIAEESALDDKTHDLAYISVLTALKCYSGMEFHIDLAIKHGATVDEIRSAMLVSMPLIGLQVKDALLYIPME